MLLLGATAASGRRVTSTGPGGGGGGSALPVPMFATGPKQNPDATLNAASATRYFSPNGSFTGYASGATQWKTAEGTWRPRIHAAGILSNFSLYIGTNARTTPTVYTLMVNGVATSVTATVAGGVTGYVDFTGTAAVAQGDLISMRVVTGTGTQNIVLSALMGVFTATGADTVNHLFCAGDYHYSQPTETGQAVSSVHGSNDSNTFGTGWSFVSGGASSVQKGANVIGTAGVISRLQVDIPVNTSTSTYRIEMYKNGLATGLFVQVAPGATGVFTDDTHTVTVAAGDNIEYRRNALASGTGTIQIGNMCCGLVTTGGFDIMSARGTGSTLQGYAGVNNYLGLSRFAPVNNDPELIGSRRHRMPKRAKATKFIVDANSQSATVAWPVTLIQNGVDTELSVSVPQPDNRYELSDTGAVQVAANDRLNVKFNTSGFSSTPHAFTISFVDPGIEQLKTPMWSTTPNASVSSVTFQAVAPGSRYFRLGGALAPYADFASVPYTSEGDWRSAAGAAGSISGLGVFVSQNNRTEASTLTLMVNGVASTTQTISIPANGTGWFSVAVDTAQAVAKDDLLSVRLSYATGDFGTIGINALEAAFLATDGTVAHHYLHGDYNSGSAARIAVASSQAGAPVSGSVAGNSFSAGWGSVVTPSAASFFASQFYTPGEIGALRAHVFSNTATQRTLLTLYKNGAATGLKVEVPAGATGFFTDSINQITIATGDKLEWRVQFPDFVSGDTGGIQFGNIQTVVKTAVAAYDIVAGRFGEQLGSDTVDKWHGPSRMHQRDADNVYMTNLRMPAAGKVKRLFGSANNYSAGTAPWNTTLVKNGTDTALSMIRPATGDIAFMLADSVEVAFAKSDRFNVRYRTNAPVQELMSWGMTIGSAE
ncbi:hypothetical protein BAJUN_02840 [Bajunvirus bajun]|uniref:Uncharacterized protein n=1 Tax=Brevundimonas phage vB_BgoS-Bajun TaxID=2948594 RepID=A0A9E7N6J6_9CAUD|nr:hypothetical protein BAJUN_02840 [Brevundimonas phage vB_BgoS-Bajun]